MVFSKIKVAQYTIVLSIRNPEKVPLILGNPHTLRHPRYSILRFKHNKTSQTPELQTCAAPAEDLGRSCLGVYFMLGIRVYVGVEGFKGLGLRGLRIWVLGF